MWRTHLLILSAGFSPGCFAITATLRTRISRKINWLLSSMLTLVSKGWGFRLNFVMRSSPLEVIWVTSICVGQRLDKEIGSSEFLLQIESSTSVRAQSVVTLGKAG